MDHLFLHCEFSCPLMVLFSFQMQCFLMPYERALESNEVEVLAILALRVFNLRYKESDLVANAIS